MKIAITAEGQDLSSQIDQRFGRAKWLIIFDTESDDFEATDNSVNLNLMQGAGIQTAQNAANFGAEAVITGNVGPNAFKILKAADIKVYLAEKQTIRDAIDSFKADKIKEAVQSNVEGHWV